jgi:hypothetical protein
MKNQRMYCPKCNESLCNGEKQMFETLYEHVENPDRRDFPLRNTWVCTNDKCIASKDPSNIFWDESGDFYGSYTDLGLHYNDITSAYPSFARKQDIEIYKRNVKTEIYLHPAFMLWFLKPLIEFNYKADEWGQILKRTWKLKFLKKFDSSEYCVYYSFPLPIIIRHLVHVNTLIKEYNDSEYYKIILEDCFKDLAQWDKRWWRHIELYLTRLLFYKKYLKLVK